MTDVCWNLPANEIRRRCSAIGEDVKAKHGRRLFWDRDIDMAIDAADIPTLGDVRGVCQTVQVMENGCELVNAVKTHSSEISVQKFIPACGKEEEVKEKVGNVYTYCSVV